MRMGMHSSRSEGSAVEWLKPRELAAREGVSRSTLWRWKEKGLVRARRFEARTGVQMRLVDRRDGDGEG
jgi:hypothetical protein